MVMTKVCHGQSDNFSERELARAGEIYQRTLELVEAKVGHYL